MGEWEEEGERSKSVENKQKIKYNKNMWIKGKNMKGVKIIKKSPPGLSHIDDDLKKFLFELAV